MGDDEAKSSGPTQSEWLKDQNIVQSKFTEGLGTEVMPSQIFALKFLDGLLFAPVRWYREKFMLPYQKNLNWYHRQYRRVPTIDECYTHDYACIEEADVQYTRDRMVEKNILEILGRRVEDCKWYYWTVNDRRSGVLARRRWESREYGIPPPEDSCTEVERAYRNAVNNFYIKYGDISANRVTAVEVLMKQKHRMIWERRHGPNMVLYQQEAMASAIAKKSNMSLYDKLVRRWYLFLGDLKDQSGEWR